MSEKIQSKVLKTIRSEEPISQKDLFAKKICGDKKVRSILKDLEQMAYIRKEKAANGTIHWSAVAINSNHSKT